MFFVNTEGNRLNSQGNQVAGKWDSSLQFPVPSAYMGTPSAHPMSPASFKGLTPLQESRWWVSGKTSGTWFEGLGEADPPET